MALIDINRNPTLRELRQFAGIWFPAFFALVGGIVWYKSGSLLAASIIWIVALAVSVLGYFLPGFMRWIFVGWMMAAFPIGWTISHLILAVIFYLIITPIGLLVRLIVGDPMQRRFDRAAKSYWVAHNPGGNTSRYFQQF
jgi:hypothetical protein